MVKQNNSLRKQKISLYSGVFGGMVTETNQMIADAIEGMRAKEIEESTVTLRISISLVDKPVVQEDGSIRVAVAPVISYKLQNAMKCVVSSAAVVDTHGMELTQDTDGGYVFAPAAGAQLSMDFDGDAEADEDGNEDNGDPGEPEEWYALPGEEETEMCAVGEMDDDDTLLHALAEQYGGEEA